MYVLSIVVCPFVLFLLPIVLSVLVRYTDSDYLPLASSDSSSHLVDNLSNMTSSTSGAGTAYPSGAPALTPAF